MEKFFCYGKKDFCDITMCDIDCLHFDGSGGENRETYQTNAERIRAQSDADLAKELAMIAEWDRKELAKAKRGPGLVAFMETWLQSPAGEDTNHA